jgi:outer membrane murein-binding lipoprotein Lpp
MQSSDYELLAQQVSTLIANVAALEGRLADVEKVNARLESAALTTARALEEISRHWEAVYEAMRREEERMTDEASISAPLERTLRKSVAEHGNDA